jgi:RimJ/RimL family protein N-acetyltransferase
MDGVDQSWQRTERLRLRPPEPGDAGDVVLLRQDPSVMRYLGGAVDSAEARRRFDGDLRHWDDHGYGMCVVEDRTTGAFTGLAGLRHFEGDPDLTYMLVAGAWGSGLATEAAGACVAWGFDGLGAELVRAMTDLRHHASQRVLAKTGLTYVGERVLWGSRQRCYAMTASAWLLRADPHPDLDWARTGKAALHERRFRFHRGGLGARRGRNDRRVSDS